MLIHSVTPPLMLTEQTPLPPMETLSVQGGYMECYRTPQGLQMARLCSTNPAMYLRKDLCPGSLCNPAMAGGESQSGPSTPSGSLRC